MPIQHVLSSTLLQVLSTRIGWKGWNERDRQSLEDLSHHVGELSRLFTRDRHKLKTQYLADERLRRAYVSYFLPVNAAKVQTLLDELSERDLEIPSVQENGPLRVLDVGSGPGTASLAALDWMQRSSGRQRGIEVTAVDNVQVALDEAQALWNAYCRIGAPESARLHCVHANLERNSWIRSIDQSNPYHVIVMANTLNELYRTVDDSVQQQVQMIQMLLERLHPHGALIIIEPALRQTTRHLHSVRDRLLMLQACTIYSPCLHEHSCPALIKKEDWCHEERPWVPPPWTTAIDREVGLIKDALKFSYAIFRKDGATIVPRNQDVFRVVSELRVLKGDSRAWLCNETGRPEVGRLDRDEVESNASVGEWHRGAIVRISGLEQKNPGSIERVKRTTSVRMIRSV
ncbi:MAG TPA: small ribosomal subunit Rsm22 family protein [Nitrospiraceae bacterium]|nr:small ribosomal subunit Rsm22 family protein [Nitrospiraceae bacterium]